MRGIYSITNTLTGTAYFGQSRDIGDRWYKHKQLLRRGKHVNERLQRAWNKYGETLFEFKILELVEDVSINLTPLEENYYNSTTNRYNLFYPGDPTIVTPETRKKISESKIGKPRPDMKNNNLFLGHKHSEETKKKY